MATSPTYLTGTFAAGHPARNLRLLIVDWHLPTLEGPRWFSAVRRTTGRHLPILFVTAAAKGKT